MVHRSTQGGAGALQEEERPAGNRPDQVDEAPLGTRGGERELREVRRVEASLHSRSVETGGPRQFFSVWVRASVRGAHIGEKVTQYN